MVDRINQQLIDILLNDARQRSEVIARQLGVSSSTVRRRIQQLIKRGVIRIVALPESSKIGLPLKAVIAFDVAHEKLDSVTDALNGKPEITWLAATSGRFDLIAIGWFSSTDRLFSFLQEVGNIEGIKDTESFICLHMEKQF